MACERRAAAAAAAGDAEADADPACVDGRWERAGWESGWLTLVRVEVAWLVGLWCGLCLLLRRTNNQSRAAARQRQLPTGAAQPWDRQTGLEWRRAQTQLLLCLTVGSAARTPKEAAMLSVPLRVCAQRLRRIACESPLAFRAPLPAADSVSCLRSADHRSIDNICHPRTFPLLPQTRAPNLELPR